MEILRTLAVFTILGGTAADPYLVDSNCTEQSKCYNLYRGDGSSWHQAYRLCRQLNQELAVIQDEASQEVVDQLARQPAVTSGVQAWISGIRTPEDSWRNLQRERFTGVISQSSPGKLCVSYLSRTRELLASQCKAEVDYKLIICQYYPQPGAPCTSGGIRVSGLCYILPQNWTLSWYEGSQLCMYMYPDSTLAYVDIQNPSLQDYIATEVSKYRQNTEVWIGINRNPWIWVSGGDRGNERLMVYSNWAPREGLGLLGHCAYVAVNKGKQWFDQPCDTKSSYFLCQSDFKPDPPNSTLPPVVNTTPASSKNIVIDRTMIIVLASVGGVIFLIIIIIVAVLSALPRKKSKSKRRHKTQVKSTPGVDNIRHAPGSQSTMQSNRTSIEGYTYPSDTYHSYMARIEPSEGFDRELQPVDVDLYKHNEQKNKKSNKKQKKGKKDKSKKNQKRTKGNESDDSGNYEETDGQDLYVNAGFHQL